VRATKTLLTVLLSVIAIVGGLFVAAAITVASLSVMLARRLFRLKSPPPSAAAPRAFSRRPTPPFAAKPEAIEITATEVVSER